MTNVEQLKSFKVKNNTIEDLIAVRGDLKNLAANFNDMSLEVPEWLSEKITEVEMEVKSLSKAEKLATLRKLKAQSSALMSRDEKRKAIDDQIAALEASI
jgi:hypothetical protein